MHTVFRRKRMTTSQWDNRATYDSDELWSLCFQNATLEDISKWVVGDKRKQRHNRNRGVILFRSCIDEIWKLQNQTRKCVSSDKTREYSLRKHENSFKKIAKVIYDVYRGLDHIENEFNETYNIVMRAAGENHEVDERFVLLMDIITWCARITYVGEKMYTMTTHIHGNLAVDLIPINVEQAMHAVRIIQKQQRNHAKIINELKEDLVKEQEQFLKAMKHLQVFGNVLSTATCFEDIAQGLENLPVFSEVYLRAKRRFETI